MIKFTRIARLLLSPLAILITLIVAAGVAHAQGATDPIAIATNGGTDALGLLAQYGPWWGGMALVFGIWSAYLEKTKSTHPIAQGKTLAFIVAATGLAGTALQAHFAGTPWIGVAYTAVMAFFKLMSPMGPSTSSTPAPQRNGQGGHVRYSTMLLIVGGVTVIAAAMSCATVKADIKAMTGKFATCAKADLNQEVKNIEGNPMPLIEDVSSAVKSNGAGLEAELLNVLKQAGLDGVECAYAAVESVLQPSGKSTSQPMPGLARARAFLAVQHAKAGSSS